MIPKIIHYCWFGGKEKPKSVIKMIDSWKKYCPDYVIKEWNESNFDINYNQYTKEAYQCGKWAFVSDVARLFAIYTEGGIYMDTDVEVVKPLDDLLTNKIFCGFEGSQLIATSCFGAEPNDSFIYEFLESYNNRSFIVNERLDTLPNVIIATKLLLRKGLRLNNTEQTLQTIHIYPCDFFTPYDYINGKLTISSNTHTIHWFSQSWIKRTKITRIVMQFYHRIFGKKLN